MKLTTNPATKIEPVILQHGGGGRNQGNKAGVNGKKTSRTVPLNNAQHIYIQSIGGIVKVVNDILPEHLKDKKYRAKN